MSNRESSKEGEERGWRIRGNRVDLVRGERKEVELKSMLPARGIGKMLEERGMCGIDEEFEQEKRCSFSKGVSVEAEYCFANAVGKFTREALKEGSYSIRETVWEM